MGSCPGGLLPASPLLSISFLPTGGTFVADVETMTFYSRKEGRTCVNIKRNGEWTHTRTVKKAKQWREIKTRMVAESGHGATKGKENRKRILTKCSMGEDE
jgi:hypothetical protein